MTSPRPVFIEHPSDLRQAAAFCGRAQVIGLDTESNSLHAYREQVCFVQIAAKGRIFLIDTVIFRDLEVLRPVFADPGISKVVHGADYDVACLKRDFGLPLASLFDTMIAAQVLGYEEVGLAALLQRHFQVSLNKALSRHDWKKRPVEPRCVQYLVDDVRYLEPLAQALRQGLRETDREEEARIEFERVARQEWTGREEADPEGFRGLKGAHSLDHEGLAVLRELYLLRDRLARQGNRPPFRVFGHHQLLEAARQRPRTLEALRRLPGFTDRLVHRHGPAVVAAVVQGLQNRDAVPYRRAPSGSRPPEEEVAVDEGLRHWRRQRVQKDGKPALVVLPNHVIARLAAQRPSSLEGLSRIEGLGGKRLRLYGEQILEIIRTPPRVRGRRRSR